MRRLGAATCVVIVGFFCSGIGAQQLPTAIPQTKFNSGQDVVPTFDGWLRNPDGTFTFVFGYMNRNYQEELAIPAGGENKVEPGAAIDQGQPTYFLARRHPWVFRVTVPGDWGQKELVWTITAHGRTEKAYASLRMEEEILPRMIQTRGNLNPGLDDPNKPPVISIEPVTRATVGSAVSLTAVVSDDGLPRPRVPKPRPDVSPGTAQTNSNARARSGLSVSWYEYRGPAKVKFEATEPVRVGIPGEPVKDGKAVASVHFSEPGTYVLRALADDGELSTAAEVTVIVSR